VDILGDGYSTFRYCPKIFLSPNPIAEAGDKAYGENLFMSFLDLPDDAYAYVPVDEAKRAGVASTFIIPWMS